MYALCTKKKENQITVYAAEELLKDTSDYVCYVRITTVSFLLNLKKIKEKRINISC